MLKGGRCDYMRNRLPSPGSSRIPYRDILAGRGGGDYPLQLALPLRGLLLLEGLALLQNDAHPRLLVSPNTEVSAAAGLDACRLRFPLVHPALGCGGMVSEEYDE